MLLKKCNFLNIFLIKNTQSIKDFFYNEHTIELDHSMVNMSWLIKSNHPAVTLQMPYTLFTTFDHIHRIKLFTVSHIVGA